MPRVSSQRTAKTAAKKKMKRITNGNSSTSSDEDDLTPTSVPAAKLKTMALKKISKALKPASSKTASDGVAKKQQKNTTAQKRSSSSEDDEDVIPKPKRLRTGATPPTANQTTGGSTILPTKPLVAPPKLGSATVFPPPTANSVLPSTVKKPAPTTPLTLNNNQNTAQKQVATKPPPPLSLPQPSFTPPQPKTLTPPPKVSKEAEDLLRAIGPYFNDKFIKSGKFSASVLTRKSERYSDVLDYVTNSQAHNFGVKMEYIVKLDRTSDVESQDCAVSNPATSLKMMLWHGTKARLVGQILEGGFRTPGPNNQMFGQGIYFADRISKSAQYCFDVCGPPHPGTIGYIFLCEVQLGRIYNARNPNHSYTSPPDIVKKNGEVLPCNSLMCTGGNIPNRERQKKIDGVIWCVGPTIKNTRFDTYTTLYNEFIVYDPNQVKIKYLVKVQFTQSPYYSYGDGVESDEEFEDSEEDGSPF